MASFSNTSFQLNHYIFTILLSLVSTSVLVLVFFICNTHRMIAYISH